MTEEAIEKDINKGQKEETSSERVPNLLTGVSAAAGVL